MKLIDIFEDHNTVHTAHQQGWKAADEFQVTAPIHVGKQQPTNPYKQGTEEYHAWREGFKHGMNSSPWAEE